MLQLSSCIALATLALLFVFLLLVCLMRHHLRAYLYSSLLQAVRALALLAKESDENKLKIVAEGALQPLESLVQSPNIFVSDFSILYVHLAKARADPYSVLPLFKNKNIQVQSHAILTIGFCAENETNRQRMAEEAEVSVE